MKISRLMRTTMLGLAMAGLITGVIWLNKPLHLPYFDQLEVAQAQSKDTEQTIPSRKLPEVNAIAFKGLGNLAFTSQGLLYVLDGSTLQIKQVTEFGSALQPRWSHDGEWLAFINVTDKSSITGPLWLVRKDGTQAHQVQGLSGSVLPQNFSWSPATNMLTVSLEDGLWVVSTEGAPHRLVQTPSPYPSFSWSPDGKSLAYNITVLSKEPESRDDKLFTVEIGEGKPIQHLQIPGTGIKVAEWQPDGKGLLFWQLPLHSASIASDGVGLYSLQFDKTEPTPLTTGLAYPEWQSFSPQGQFLTVTGSDRIVWANKSLVVANPKTGKLQHIQNPKDFVAIDPQYSPDGKKIAYVAAKNLGENIWGFNKADDLETWVNSRTLYVANADGSNAHALSMAGQGIYQPTWSKEGRHILFVKGKSLWSINTEAGSPEKILDLESEQEDQFGFYGFTSYQNTFSWYKG